MLLPLVILMAMSPGQLLGMGGIGGGGTDLVITPGPMKSPMRIAPAGKDETGTHILVASDYQGRKIYKVNPTNPDQPTVLFETAGSPLAVEAARSFLIVGNDSDGTIEVYTRTGIKVRTYVTDGPVQASDIVYDMRLRQIFVADSLNREIKVFNELGEQLRSFGSAAPLSDPKGLAVDPVAQRVFVSDYGDPRLGIAASINVFDYQGALIHRITGSFSRPQGIALDRRNIYVVDAMLGQILVFDRASYAAKTPLGSYGVNAGQLLLPMDLTQDPGTGKLFVTNNRMGRVTPFTPPTP